MGSRPKIFPRTRTPCFICEKMELKWPVLKCDNYSQDSHILCLDISRKEALLIKTCYCDTCQEEKGLSIEFEYDPKVDGAPPGPGASVLSARPTNSNTTRSPNHVSNLEPIDPRNELTGPSGKTIPDEQEASAGPSDRGEPKIASENQKRTGGRASSRRS